MRRSLRQEAKEKMRGEQYDAMPTIEVDKQIDQLGLKCRAMYLKAAGLVPRPRWTVLEL